MLIAPSGVFLTSIIVSQMVHMYYGNAVQEMRHNEGMNRNVGLDSLGERCLINCLCLKWGKYLEHKKEFLLVLPLVYILLSKEL